MDAKILLTSLILCTASVLSLPHLQKAFKCAGDRGLVCETGLCYDALGFYEDSQNVGCAPKEMCTQVGCLMYKGVFTCCCANRFCNGKTEMLMLAKYEMFKQNRGRWPTNLPPRIFARNITVAPSTPASESDVRKAPTRKLTTTTQSAERENEPTKMDTKNDQKVVEKKEESTNSKLNLLLAQSSASTTTQIANLTPQQAQPRPLIIEQEVKLPSHVQDLADQKQSIDLSLSAEDSMERDNERTTRSNTGGKDQPTTTRPKKQRKEKATTTTVEPPKITTVKATHREAHYPSHFPWYAVTIVGFILASIIGALGYFAYQRYRRWQAQKGRRTPSDSMRHPSSSVDSSLLADEAQRR